MRKSTLLKLMGTCAAVMFSFGVIAQNPAAPYAQYDANVLTPTNVDYVTLRTGGTTTLGYYALPDPLYHPTYVASGTLTAGFVWNWSIAPVMTINKPGAANYVEIVYTATGDYVVNVSEEAPASMGGCEDGTPTVMNVTVIDPPTADISIAPTATAPAVWQAIAANLSYQICGSQAAQTVTIAFNESVPNDLAAYSFAIAYKVETIDGDNNVIDLKTPWSIVRDFTSASKLKDGNIGDIATGFNPVAFNRATPVFTYTFTTDALNILKRGATTTDARTKYSYKLVRTGTVAGDVEVSTDTDFRSAISAKSDYLATALYYDFTNSAVSFIVNPMPSTGPIYHIPNTYAY